MVSCEVPFIQVIF